MTLGGCTYLRLRRACNAFHREPLAGVILHRRKQHQCDSWTFTLDGSNNILLSQNILAGPRRELEDGIVRVEAMQRSLRGKRILSSDNV